MLLSEALVVDLDSDSAGSGYRIWTRRYLYLIRTMTGKACTLRTKGLSERKVMRYGRFRRSGCREIDRPVQSFFDNASRGASNDCPGQR